MAKYRFTNKAVDDLSNIWNYTVETWSERQADLYYEMLIGFCQAFADNTRSARITMKFPKNCTDSEPINT